MQGLKAWNLLSQHPQSHVEYKSVYVHRNILQAQMLSVVVPLVLQSFLRENLCGFGQKKRDKWVAVIILKYFNLDGSCILFSIFK